MTEMTASRLTKIIRSRGNSVARMLAVITLLTGVPLSGVAHAQNWGIILGGVAEGMRSADEDKLKRKALELEEQRLQLIREQQRIARENEERRFRDEQRAREEAEHREKQARIDAYRAGNMGSGFFVSQSGHIITNAHVIGDYEYVIARDSDGGIYQLDVLAIDKSNDLALLQASKKTEGLPISNSADVAKGLKVFAIGFPQPSIQGTESKITDGIISSMTGIRNDTSHYQISVPIQAGNSGGPLVTESGAVVGVVVSTVNAAKFLSITGDIPQNINFAIKPDTLMAFLKSNGLNAIRQGKVKRNPLGFVDRNTVLIAARPEPFNFPATPSPSAKIAKVEALRPSASYKQNNQSIEENAVTPERTEALGVEEPCTQFGLKFSESANENYLTVTDVRPTKDWKSTLKVGDKISHCRTRINEYVPVFTCDDFKRYCVRMASNNIMNIEIVLDNGEFGYRTHLHKRSEVAPPDSGGE